ncbi:helix-turn-helix domain-containing protein [Mucilaginibacter pedocola]|uniref:Transcriptional regulator n=1 Tax=Mucilaginibacter pedocola TaxID=1792845 RepID=A0A1S9PC81_9SPHI|nr:AraC family transcriptional regulator [Mucilaginibacter pedocola]OOQ58188.1 transcriptional regulator [Mucilaginibacter pedocola]
MPKVIALNTFYQYFNQQIEGPESDSGRFNIFRVEDTLLPGNKPVAYTRRDFYKVSLVTGHNKIHYADQTIEVDNGVLVFTNPLIPFSWERIGDGHSGFVCIFTEGFFSRSGNIKDYPVFQNAASAVVPLNENLERFQHLFARMYTELQSDYAYKYDLLRNLLMEVVHEALKLQPATGQPLTGANGAERISTLFTDLLERQFPIDATGQTLKLRYPGDFAMQMNIHVNHLNKALKETTGKTTSQLIADRLLREAKLLLKSTTWTINEIAWCLGFEEPNHFSAFFKSHAKTTAMKFRQQASV